MHKVSPGTGGCSRSVTYFVTTLIIVPLLAGSIGTTTTVAYLRAQNGLPPMAEFAHGSLAWYVYGVGAFVYTHAALLAVLVGGIALIVSMLSLIKAVKRPKSVNTGHGEEEEA